MPFASQFTPRLAPPSYRYNFLMSPRTPQAHLGTQQSVSTSMVLSEPALQPNYAQLMTSYIASVDPTTSAKNPNYSTGTSTSNSSPTIPAVSSSTLLHPPHQS